MTGTEILCNKYDFIPTKYEMGEALTRENFFDFALGTFGPANGVPLAQGFLIDFYSLNADVNPTVLGTLADIVAFPWPEELSNSNTEFLTNSEIARLQKFVPNDENHQYINAANIASKFRSALKHGIDVYHMNKAKVFEVLEITENDLIGLNTNKFLTSYLQPVKAPWINNLAQRRVFNYLNYK
jgi:hypothetical protein